MSKPKAILTLAIAATMAFCGIALATYIPIQEKDGVGTTWASRLSKIVISAMLMCSGIYLANSITEPDEES